MQTVNVAKVPSELAERNQWVLWKTVRRGNDKPTKVPYQVDGTPASSTDNRTWATLANVLSRQQRGGYSGIGYVFAADDPYCGIDLDGCRNPETGKVSEWAREMIVTLDSYGEVSPSKTGVKLFVRGKLPFQSGKKKDLDHEKISEKQPGVEMYDHGRYFAVTGWKLAGIPNGVETRQTQLEQMCSELWPAPEAPPVKRVETQHDICERARRYVAKMPPAISGQSGHNATFYVACVLVLGFELSEAEALGLLLEYNQRCDPPWTERELRHKVDSAGKQTGPRGYLKNAQERDWHKIKVPKYEAPKPATLTTLERSATDYVECLKSGQIKLVDLGIGDVDYAIGGGVAFGEMVILAGRPSHGKSAVALQCLHNATRDGFPALFISEEMSGLAIGKRAIQFASEVPEEHWKTSSSEVERDLSEHFITRAPCYVAESCRTPERVGEVVAQAVDEHGVRVVAIDYAQLLQGKGGTRYEQITNTSVVLRGIANEHNVLLLTLCQMNRQVESEKSFVPKMSHLKDSGQLEQDSDVILFLLWPHRLDNSEDPHRYVVFVGKNRNRPINKVVCDCQFLPSRQMLKEPPVENHANHHDEFAEFAQ